MLTPQRDLGCGAWEPTVVGSFHSKPGSWGWAPCFFPEGMGPSQGSGPVAAAGRNGYFSTLGCSRRNKVRAASWALSVPRYKEEGEKFVCLPH